MVNTRRRLLEGACVGALFAAGLAFAVAEGFFATTWLGLAALGSLGLALIGTAVFAILALRQRRWLAAIVWLVGLAVLAPSALVGGVAAGFAGKMLSMEDFGTRTLPLERRALHELAASGKQLAAQLGTDFALDAVVVTFGPRGREVDFEVVAGESGFFQAGIRFRQNAGGAWKPDGNSCSGDTETFQANSKRFEAALAKTSAPSITWPLPEGVEQDWIAAAGELAGVLSSVGALDTAGIAWQPEKIRMSHSLRAGNNDSVSIWLDAKHGRDVVASVVTYWAFDGKRARLTDANGLVQKGTASRSTLEQGAEIRSILEPWLASQNGLLAPSAMFASRNDATWTACETVLPDGTTLIYREQLAHPFLAEYQMRLEIRPPEGEARDFLLPMNTGGRTAILVDTGSSTDGTPAVRVNAGRHFDLAFTLRNPRIIPAESVGNTTPLGAFTGVRTRLRWASATDAADRELYEATRNYFSGTGN